MPFRGEYDKELKELHKSLLKMGSYIEQSIDDTMEAFEKQNAKLAREVIERDDIIDSMETAIETECLLLIARQQPIAGDLRMIASILKIITDLERIADQCADISEITVKLSEHPYIHFIDEILDMANQVKKMIKQTIDTYVALDVHKAISTAKEDDIVDNYFSDIVQKTQNLMKQDAEFIEQGTNFIFIVKYLERMADHATNICEWVAYRVTGNRQQYN
jgi:phosphate transport system protein